MKSVFQLGFVATMVFMMAGESLGQDRLSLYDGKLSLGGELRGRFEMLNDYYNNLGSSDVDDERFLLRTKVHLDFKPDERWQIFLEAQDAREFGSDIINRHAVPNSFEDDLDLFQAYLRINQVGDLPLSLKLGRQILSYGQQRLIGGFLWSNTSRVFDAAKATYELDDWGGSIDVFVGQAWEPDWGNFNDIWGNQDTLYGVYTRWEELEFFGFVELYYLLKERSGVDTEIHTFGTRLGNTYDSGWDWEAEVVGQLGDFNGLDHQAFAMFLQAGYSFDHEWSPRVALGYAFSPGDDDPSDGDHNTFDNLYPTNHIHYGQMDLFSWRNMHDIELEISAKPMERLLTKIELHNFFLDEEETDHWYNAGGAIVRSGAPGADAYVGAELGFTAQYKLNDWVTFEGGYAHFFAGDFVDDTGDDDDADWAYFQTTITF